jgi:hypothetical protein
MTLPIEFSAFNCSSTTKPIAYRWLGSVTTA